jgi:hypothetical protein
MKLRDIILGVIGGTIPLIILLVVAWWFDSTKSHDSQPKQIARVSFVEDGIINLPSKNLNIGDAAIVIRITPNTEVTMAFTYEKKCDEGTLGVTVVGGGCWVFRGFSEWFEEKEIK